MSKFPPFQVGPDGLIIEVPLHQIRCSPNSRGSNSRRLTAFMVIVSLIAFAAFGVIAVRMDRVLTVEKSTRTGQVIRVLDHGSVVDPDLMQSHRFEIVYVP